jgi:hypothetical protein
MEEVIGSIIPPYQLFGVWCLVFGEGNFSLCSPQQHLSVGMGVGTSCQFVVQLVRRPIQQADLLVLIRDASPVSPYIHEVLRTTDRQSSFQGKSRVGRFANRFILISNWVPEPGDSQTSNDRSFTSNVCS